MTREQFVHMSSILLLVVLSALVFLANFTLNNSPSEPIGVYLNTREQLRVGTLVRLHGPMKEIAAMPGAHVRFAPEGIYVEGKLVPLTAPEAGMPHFPFGNYVVPDQMFVGVGRHPDSWDARYLGFLPLSLVASTLKPVWTK